MCKVFVFSGSHGVGKTSLVTKISTSITNKKDNNFKIFQEFNTGLYNIGFALNGSGYNFNEVIFSQQQAFNLGYNTICYYLQHKEDPRKIIFDRSPIDTFLYTKYFIQQKNCFQEYSHVLKDMEEKSNELASQIYTMLVPAFQDFDANENRMSILEQTNIWELFIDYFKNNIDKNNYSILKGESTDLRYEEIIKLIY